MERYVQVQLKVNNLLTQISTKIDCDRFKELIYNMIDRDPSIEEQEMFVRNLQREINEQK
jgi:hypothetical protein